MFGRLASKLLAVFANLIFLEATPGELAALAGLSTLGCASACAKLKKCGVLKVDEARVLNPPGTTRFFIDARWLDELERGSQQSTQSTQRKINEKLN
jgi:hypothetical protein